MTKQEKIEKLAYFLYEKSEYKHGNDKEHWNLAEFWVNLYPNTEIDDLKEMLKNFVKE